MNSRFAVYEPQAIERDFAGIGLDEARSRAYEGLAGLAAGRTELAGAILQALVIAGDPAAVEALADVARGMWRTAIVLLAAIGAEAARQEQGRRARAR